MAFLVRSKGRPVHLRDMGRDGRPMIRVGLDPVLLLDLPPSSKRHPGGDKDIEVVPVVDVAGMHLPEALRAKMPQRLDAKDAEPAPAAPEPAAVAEPAPAEPETSRRKWRRG